MDAVSQSTLCLISNDYTSWSLLPIFECISKCIHSNHHQSFMTGKMIPCELDIREIVQNISQAIILLFLNKIIPQYLDVAKSWDFQLHFWIERDQLTREEQTNYIAHFPVEPQLGNVSTLQPGQLYACKVGSVGCQMHCAKTRVIKCAVMHKAPVKKSFRVFLWSTEHFSRCLLASKYQIGGDCVVPTLVYTDRLPPSIHNFPSAGEHSCESYGSFSSWVPPLK